MVGRISVKIGLAIGPFLESCLLSERTDCQMLAATIESVSGMVIRFFSKEELLSDVSASYLQKAVLSDKIWIDETYWRISDHRLIQTHPDGKSLRGLSCNLV